MRSSAGRIRGLSYWSIVLAIVLSIGAVIPAAAQNVVPEARKTPTPFSKMKVAPGTLGFKRVTFGKTAVSQSKTFSIRNVGTEALTVIVAAPVTSQFAIVQGEGPDDSACEGGAARSHRAVCSPHRWKFSRLHSNRQRCEPRRCKRFD